MQHRTMLPPAIGVYSSCCQRKERSRCISAPWPMSTSRLTIGLRSGSDTLRPRDFRWCLVAIRSASAVSAACTNSEMLATSLANRAVSRGRPPSVAVCCASNAAHVTQRSCTSLRLRRDHHILPRFAVSSLPNKVPKHSSMLGSRRHARTNSLSVTVPSPS